MNESVPLDLEREIDSLAARFDAAWGSELPLQIDDVMSAASAWPADAQDRLAEELVAIDWELRWSGGLPLKEEEYASRFPHLDLNKLRPGLDTENVTAACRSPRQPVEVPGYRLLEEVGRGGVSRVFRAEDERLKRTVALKLLHPSVALMHEERERITQEAESMARLRHPNIVQIFEIGECQGNAFLVLEYLDGGSLRNFTSEKSHPPRVAATVTASVASAVEFAHRNGIVHRDIKPANILLDTSHTVELNDSDSSWSFSEEDRNSALYGMTPKVADFGLAKMLDTDSRLTQTGTVLGTPAYMSPEQASGNHKQVNATSDVYSIGAVLYEMLTGRPPFLGPDPASTLRMVCESEPVPPSRLHANLPRDLETICLKCLRKDPQQRYQSAGDLAADCARYLRGETILARRPSAIERVTKWVQRNPRMSVALLTTVIALIISVWQWVSAEAAAQAARQAEFVARQLTNAAIESERVSQRRLADSYLKAWHESADRGDGLGALHFLVAGHFAERDEDSDPDRNSRDLIARQRVESMLARSPKLVWYSNCESDLRDVRFDPGNRRLLICQEGRPAQLVDWTARSGQQTELPAHLLRARFDRSGNRIAAIDSNGRVCLFDSLSGAILREFRPRDSRAAEVTINAEGTIIAVAIPAHDFAPMDPLRHFKSMEAHIYAWDCETGDELANLDLKLNPARSSALTRDQPIFRFGSSGDALLTVGIGGPDINPREPLTTEHLYRSSLLRIPLPQDKDQPFTYVATRGQIEPIDIEGDRSKVMCAIRQSLTQPARLMAWDTQSGQMTEAPLPSDSVLLRGHRADFSPDGKTWAYLDDDSTIAFVDLDSGEVRRRDYRQAVTAFAFGPNGQYLAVALDSHRLRVESAKTGRQAMSLIPLDDIASRLDFDPSGRFLLTTTTQGGVWVWDLFSAFSQRNVLVKKPVDVAAYDADGSALAYAVGNEVFLRRGDDPDVKLPVFHQDDDTIRTLRFSPDGNDLFANSNFAARLTRLDDAMPEVRLNHRRSALSVIRNQEISPEFFLRDRSVISPDFRYVYHDDLSSIHRLDDSKRRLTVAGRFFVGQFSPTRGQFVYDNSSGIHLVDCDRQSKHLIAERDIIDARRHGYMIRFSRGGNFALLAIHGRGLVAIDCRTKEVIFRRELPTVAEFVFDDEEESFLACCSNGTVRRIELTSGTQLAAFAATSSVIMTAAAQKHKIYFGTRSGKVVLWNQETAEYEEIPWFVQGEAIQLIKRPSHNEMLTLTDSGILERQVSSGSLQMKWSDCRQLAKLLSTNERPEAKPEIWRKLRAKYPRYFRVNDANNREWHATQLSYAKVLDVEWAIARHDQCLRQLDIHEAIDQTDGNVKPSPN